VRARPDCWIIIAVDPVEIYGRLSTARRLAQQVEPPSRMYSDFSLAAGYALARLLDQEMLAGGAVRVGTKLGFTNQEVWSQVGLDMPFWSPISTPSTPRPAGSGPSSPECVAMGRRAELH
jgi:hypothetical protein